MVRKMKLPPLSSTLSRAISNLQYADACKVALHFKTRFWEHLPKPIFGGCAFTDIPGVQSFCYPSYKMNSTGPGVMLGSYNFAEWSMRTVQLSDKDHAEYVLDAMAEIHGPVVREQYTGKFNRQCWLLDEYTNGGWAHPSVGQHALYIPSYFRTENNVSKTPNHSSSLVSLSHLALNLMQRFQLTLLCR